MRQVVICDFCNREFLDIYTARKHEFACVAKERVERDLEVTTKYLKELKLPTNFAARECFRAGEHSFAEKLIFSFVRNKNDMSNDSALDFLFREVVEEFERNKCEITKTLKTLEE